MANICSNLFYAYSEIPKNIAAIEDFFSSNYEDADIEESENSLDILFDSRWTFPEEEMEKLYESIPNKEDIYMRCLSYEFGNKYHALWECDENGWEVV